MAERTPVVNGGSGNRIELQSGDTVAGLTRTLFNRYADRTTTTTAQETFWTDTIAANTFISDGGAIQVIYAGTTANNADEKEWQLQLNGTALIGPNYIANVSDWQISTTIIRASNTELRCLTVFTCGNGSQQPVVDHVSITSLNLTTTGYNLVLKVTTPDLIGDVTAKFMKATYLPGV